MMMLEQLDRAVEDDPDHMAGEVPPLSSPSHGASHRRVARAVAPRTTRSGSVFSYDMESAFEKWRFLLRQHRAS